MEFLESTYTLSTMVLLSFILGTTMVIRMMNAVERTMLTGTALFLAGLFFVGRHPEDGLMALVGSILWAVGLTLFVSAGLHWRRHHRGLGAWALFFVFPVALFGAVLAGGVLVTLLAAPAEAAMALVGR